MAHTEDRLLNLNSFKNVYDLYINMTLRSIKQQSNFWQEWEVS